MLLICGIQAHVNVEKPVKKDLIELTNRAILFELEIKTPYPRRMQVSHGSIIDVSLSSETLQDHAAGHMQSIMHLGQHFYCRAHYLCIELIPIIVSPAFILTYCLSWSKFYS